MELWKGIGTNMATCVQLQVNILWRQMMDQFISRMMQSKRICLIMGSMRKAIRLAMMSSMRILKNTTRRARLIFMRAFIRKWKYDIGYVENGNWCHASLLRWNRSFKKIKQLLSIRHGLYDRRQSWCLADRNQQQSLPWTFMSSFSLFNT